MSDGDFLEAYWLHAKTSTHHTPIVILFHGLAGSFKSPYIQGMMQKLSNNGFSSVVMHFRGCATQENLLPRSYHSGETGDAKEFIAALHKKYPKTPLYAIGYSLGANMLLKLLGEQKNNTLLKKAVAVSTPMQLDLCAQTMNKGFAKYYQYKLLKDLKNALRKKFVKHDMQSLLKIQEKQIRTLNTLKKYDDAYTAPIHGFLDANDYYQKCSAKQFLKYIQVPTLIIHSKDDPFMVPDVLPNKEEISDAITMCITDKGGHVGFVAGSFFKPIYWLEEKAIEFFKKKS